MRSSRRSRAFCGALQLGASTIQPRLNELEAAGLVISDPPYDEAHPRRGIWVRYWVNNEAVTELHLRLGLAIGEF